MSVTHHRAAGPASIPCAVVTISDTRTADTDASGDRIAALLTAAGHTIVARKLVRDDGAGVREAVRAQLGGHARAIITTGGTGIAGRDQACDAITALFEKPLDGFGELFRRLSYDQIGAAAMLSRACAGIARGKVIFVLPGSTGAVTLALEQLILPELPHIGGELSKTT